MALASCPINRPACGKISASARFLTSKATATILYRRSVYTFWRRSVGPTMLFDNAGRQVCTVRPSLTNTPLHALTLLNDTTFVEAGRKFAERVIRES